MFLNFCGNPDKSLLIAWKRLKKNLYFRSIGCILYELCALDHAFNGTSLMAVMYKIVEGEPPDLPGNYSKELNRILKL